MFRKEHDNFGDEINNTQIADLSRLSLDGSATIAGMIDGLEQGDGFIVVSGRLVTARAGIVSLPVCLTLDNKMTTRVTRLELQSSDDTEMDEHRFVLLVKTSHVFAMVPHGQIVTADGVECSLTSTATTVETFNPSGQLSFNRSDVLDGLLIDPTVWLGKRTATVQLLGSLTIPVVLLPVDISSRFEVSDSFGLPDSVVNAAIAMPLKDVEACAAESYYQGPEFFGGKLVPGRHDVSLMVDGDVVVQTSIDIVRAGKGYIEAIKETTILGWAAGADYAVPAKVDILWDGIRYATVTAKDHREDLIRKGIVGSGGGFRFKFESAPGSAVTGQVSAVLQESGIPLGRSIALGKTAGNEVTVPILPLAEIGALHVQSEAKFLPICIIIPIYNAADDLRRCLISLERNVTTAARLIMVDDCSPDPQISVILDAWDGRPNVQIIRNKQNLGFSGSINAGVSAAGRSDVVLLNSDTLVTNRWLEKLWQSAYSAPNIATATAVSNNAGAFSVPETGTNIYSDWLDVEATARLVQHNAGSLYPEVPTGNGFCMYVRRDCLDKVGLLDAKAFPRGYGEENDFCMRAMRMGYRNVVDDRTFIHHKRSASFGSEKTELYEQGRETVLRRYPEYTRLTPVFSEDPAFLSIRWRVRKALSNAEKDLSPPLGRILFVISTQSGGTPQTNRDLMAELGDRYETWVLRCDSKMIELSRYKGGTTTIFEHRVLQRALVMSLHRSDEYDKIVSQILTLYAFQLVHIRHIAWHSLRLPAICQQLRIPSVFSFHDFYTVCPTVKLLDEENRFCAGRCTPSEGECKAELWPSNQIPPLKHRFIHEWQAKMNAALSFCDAFVTTSPGAAALLKDIFTVVAERGIETIPHGRSFDDMASLAASPDVDEPLRILMPGNINPAKGSELCEAVIALPGRREVEFHVLGDAGTLQSRPGLVLHGRYKREEFSQKVSKLKPHVGTVLSIWPETYCHTLTEMWAAGIPVVAVDFGAVGERIREHGGGWLVSPDAGPEQLAELLKSIRRGRAGYDEKRAAVLRWQATYGKFYRTEVMADQYDLLYRRLGAERRVLQRPDSSVGEAVVVVISQFIPNRGTAPASAHIRIGEVTRNDADRPLLFRHYKSYTALGHQLGQAPRVVIVQRDTLDPEDVDDFISLCRNQGIYIVVDCDDDLLSVPEDKDADGRYRDGRASFTRLLRSADLVSVSTQALVEAFSSLSDKVRLLPNILSARLWLKPLPARPARSSPDKIIALYMGTVTHDADLQLLKEAILTVQARHPHFELHVVGGRRSDEDWFRRIDIPGAAKNYPQFVEWFRTQCLDVDFAVGPLVDTSFNRCKSDLKFLDYSAAGLAGVYSDVESYRGAIQSGKTGLLVRNDPAHWAEAICWMIEHPDRRRQLAARAYAVVRAERVALSPGRALQDAIVELLASSLNYQPRVMYTELDDHHGRLAEVG